MSSEDPPDEVEGINALSIDGGSIASLMSSIELLEELARRMQRVLGLSEPPLLCEHFSLMVGAGFAGLLVIMLGRLRMSVQEAKRHCVNIMDEAFSERKLLGSGAFKRTKLTAAVERMLESCGAGAGTRMLCPGADNHKGCKAMVCVAPESGMRAGMPACMRTYITDTSGVPDCTIVEAVCSTFAVPGVFKPMDVREPGGIVSRYVGLESFNPMAQLLDEVVNIFQDGYVACITSVGAQQKGALATECERTARDMTARFATRPGLYFRLSVDRGMESIGTIDWQKRLDGVAHARSYLRLSENDARMTEVAQVLAKAKARMPVTQLRGSTAEVSSADYFIKPCPLPSPLFTGRDTQLERIHRCLSSDEQKQCVCVLHGLGGVGKTQLAFKFAEVYKNEQVYQHIFYIDSTSKSTIDADLTQIALAKKAGRYSSDALLWLARLQERWLIIYNNADDTSLNLRGYFPVCSHGNILVTTRNHGMVNITRGIDASCHVSSMSEDEAYRLLAKAAGLSEIVDAPGEELVKDYLDMYRTSRGQILEDYASEVQKADDYELTVYATWQVSYRQLTPLARQLFDHLAFMHHDQIIEDIFRFALRGLRIGYTPPPTDEEKRIEQVMAEFLANFTSLADGSWDKARFLRATKDLASYSLLTYDSANRSYSIHPLVQQWTRAVATDPDTTLCCVASLLALSVMLEERTEDYAYRRVLLNHVDRLPDSEKRRPRHAWRLALVYKESGRWKEAEALQREVVAIGKRVRGSEHPETLISMNNLALTYSNQGRQSEAEVLQREVLEVGKRVWGKERPDTLISMGNLALTYSKQGRWDEAEVLQREVVEVGKQVRGNEHPETLMSMNNLALTYSRQGRWDEAEALQREVVEVGKRVRGNGHPDTLIAMGNLAATYSKQGRWDEAEALERAVVEVGKRVWGNEHPHTLTVMGNLAATYLNQGRWSEAEALQREVIEVGKRVWGNEHPYTLIAMAHLASTYSNQGRRNEAEALQREVVEVGKRVWGNEHPHNLIAMRNLAATDLAQRRWDEAGALQQELLEIGERVWGSDHPKTLAVMVRLSSTYSRQERWKEAEDLLCEVLEAEQRVWGHVFSQTLILLATVYSSQELWDDAEGALEDAVETRREVHGDQHPITLDAMRRLDDVQSQIDQLCPGTPTTSSEVESPASSSESLYLSAAEDAETSDDV
ncbi:hypothetical protein FRC07_000316 [Ceratobasidium sp. 392]|nr:hypothetical protein FRC07_000316 [Ceratobasidium sp. 392]